MTATYPEDWTNKMPDGWEGTYPATSKHPTDSTVSNVSKGNGKIIEHRHELFRGFGGNGKKPNQRTKNNRKLEKRRRKEGRKS